MADIKRKVLTLSSSKQIRLYGNSVAISRSLEIGEGYAPNILSFNSDQPGSKGGIINPYQLNTDELMELADFNIQLWMDLKANLRRFGLTSTKLFTGDSGKQNVDTITSKWSNASSTKPTTE